MECLLFVVSWFVMFINLAELVLSSSSHSLSHTVSLSQTLSLIKIIHHLAFFSLPCRRVSGTISCRPLILTENYREYRRMRWKWNWNYSLSRKNILITNDAHNRYRCETFLYLFLVFLISPELTSQTFLMGAIMMMSDWIGWMDHDVEQCRRELRVKFCCISILNF